MAEQHTTDVTPGPGGVMTDEVGVVTGELTLRTEVDDAGAVVLRVQYKDADEWYTVTGAKATLTDVHDVDAVHAIAVALLNRPEGWDSYGVWSASGTLLTAAGTLAAACCAAARPSGVRSWSSIGK